ncbi:uncharacterized protein TRIADDRAFT_54062 [Trichoplax adhaerens]|uniref:Unconventional myosin-X n=1 Tax=Trichoplax adhaerens TaxID=10228 RepID=B3RR02_TRIAD|nr:hypothetical protein TRIADDRAFT_54062 [Trichoplax adhaerens]EDV26792.1 hypothetical protein TRIADDRAFT_54062 [Trichoplax adhaerens]|eukprot:XP_002110788.1 hypothetical protein TRIADDRAFT_54062 [Trichoplax adhaerens]
MDTQMTQGAHVWVFSGQKWLPATVTQVAGGMITLETSYGEVITEAVVDCNRNKLTQMHSSSVDGVDDMATLGDLHEASILYNLKIRYISNHIYTYVGSILVSVNPYKSIPGLYASDLIGLYQKMRLSDLPPHVFAVANEMYCCLIENRRSQCAIVSGESGAGKTETTKHILNYLTSISHKIQGDSSLTKGKVERVLVESRFVREEALHLKDASQFHYLNQSGCIKDDTIDDLESYKDVMSAMQVMSFKEDEINDILQLLAGILLIGNTTFMTSGGAQIEDESVVWQVAELLGLDPYEFTIALTQKQMYLRGEQISTPLDVQQAEDSRDSMAMSIYRHCFRYIISRINSRIVSEGDHKSIGVLDIFGFENFKVNRFEQFNINYANEKLQSFFNKHIFSLEQYEYNREGIEWSDINWIDNSECLDLIERGNRYFIKPKVNQAKFGVKHYAGDYEKGRKARLVFQELLYIKKLEEEKKREEERLAAERKRKELERLEQEKMLKEFEELKQKMEEEERLKKEQEERERQRLEEEIMMELQRIKEREEARKAEMLAKKKIEEAERKKQEEKERQLAEEEERKKQELKKELTLESILQGDGDLYSSISDRFESEELSDEEESEYDEISIKESVSEYLGYEGYLSMKAGMMNNWKRRWGVLTSDNLMWFRSKQTVLKSGWLTIRNGPAATVSKKQPRSRWFVLKDNVLKYKESDQDGARTVGKIEIKSITKLERDPTSDNSLIVTTKGSKAHYFSADSHEDCSQWLASLHSVMAADASEVRKVADETSYFKSALDALDMDEISSVYPHSIASKPGSFAIITTERIYNFVADTPQIMEEWVLNIQKVKESYQTEHTGSGSEGKGWLYRENPTQGTKKKCWAILTSNGMEFYKNPEKEKLRVQSLVFNSLCSVYGPEEKMSGDNVLWTFTVYVRRQVHYFFTKFQEDSMAWVNSIQRVIDNKPRLIMPTERLISKIRTIHSHNLFCYFIKIFQDSNDVEIEDIYRSNPILNYSNTSIKAPLLALPYGKTVGANDKKKRGYGTISEEAVKTFNSLLTSETVGDYLALIQSQLQKFHDLPELRDEIYCQVIKQTNISNNPDSIGNLRYWQFLACLCCTRAPSRKYLYYLKFYLQRSLKRFPNTEAAKFMEFCLTACTKTKPREYPPGKEEIIAILGRRPILTYIYTYGNSSVKALVDSSIIADEVVQRLRLGLGLSNTKNCYALFEKCGTIYRAIDGRTVMTDILAKFEIYRTRGIGEGTNRWQIFFKPYCFIDLKSISCIAEEFLMFEEARESVVNGHFLNSEPTLVRLAALYQQFNHGDYFAGAWISNLEEIYPIKKSVDVSIKMEDPLSKLKSSHGFGSLGASFRKQSKIVKPEENVNINFQEMTEDEKSAIKSSIVEKWKQLKGMTEDTALEQYMDIIRTWPGSSATIFDVKVISGGFAVTKVWLAIGYENITIYKRGESVALSTMDYNGITWSGIESNSNYKIIIDKTKSIIFETNQVAEIAKLIKVCHEMRRKRISQIINLQILTSI